MLEILLLMPKKIPKVNTFNKINSVDNLTDMEKIDENKSAFKKKFMVRESHWCFSKMHVQILC